MVALTIQVLCIVIMEVHYKSSLLHGQIAVLRSKEQHTLYLVHSPVQGSTASLGSKCGHVGTPYTHIYTIVLSKTVKSTTYIKCGMAGHQDVARMCTSVP